MAVKPSPQSVGKITAKPSAPKMPATAPATDLAPGARKKPDDPFVAHLLDLLAPWADVRARAMFGGYGIYAHDLMIGLVAYGVLYLKADADLEPEFIAAGSKPFIYEDKGKTMQMSYWSAPVDALEDPELMAAWATKALAAQQRAQAMKAGKHRKAIAKPGPKPTAKSSSKSGSKPGGRPASRRP